jgi:hypothetical protein
MTDAPNALTRSCIGVSGLRALGISACARMSICSKQIGGIAVRAS